jgi:hypothetical protein
MRSLPWSPVIRSTSSVQLQTGLSFAPKGFHEELGQDEEDSPLKERFKVSKIVFIGDRSPSPSAAEDE